MFILELLTVICGLYGAYATASQRRRQRQLGFIVFTVGALAAIPLYLAKGLYMVTMLSAIYVILDLRGVFKNTKST